MDQGDDAKEENAFSAKVIPSPPEDTDQKPCAEVQLIEQSSSMDGHACITQETLQDPTENVVSDTVETTLPNNTTPEVTAPEAQDNKCEKNQDASAAEMSGNRDSQTVANVKIEVDQGDSKLLELPVDPLSEVDICKGDSINPAQQSSSIPLSHATINEMIESDEEGDEVVPIHCFWHVVNCLLNGFTKDMQVEIQYGEDKFWIGVVSFGIGRMLALTWEGGSPIFWIDLSHQKVYPLGYFRNKKEVKIAIPQQVVDKQHAADFRILYGDEAIVDSVNVPEALFEFQGLRPCDIFTEGSIVEVSHENDPSAHWFAKVHSNIGGRLKLKWIELHADFKDSLNTTLSTLKPDGFFYLYFCHPRISPLGFAMQDEYKEDYIYKQPDHIGEPDPELLERCLEEIRKPETELRNKLIDDSQAERPCLLKDGYQSKIVETDRVLIMAPDSIQLVPATIEKITPVGDMYILSDVPVKEKKIEFYYEYDDRYAVLPMSWADEHDLNVDLPELKGLEFDAKKYVEKRSARSAGIKLIRKWKDISFDEFEINAKIEVVHPNDATKICEGVIIRRTCPLVWIEISPELIVVLPFNSTELFPAGWCANHGHPLTKLIPERKCILEELPAFTEEDTRHSQKVLSHLPHYATGNNAWCPRIYFNHKCFTGSYISKGKISELPQYVGPGPVVLVMHEVISKIFSIAYVPNRCLNELASKNFVSAMKRKNIRDTQLVLFKAKYQKRSYRDQIPVVAATDQIDEYCKVVCTMLKACTNLFGVRRYDGDICPANCRNLTKSKTFKRSSKMRDPGRLSQVLGGGGKKRTINDKEKDGTGRSTPNILDSIDEVENEDTKSQTSQASSGNNNMKDLPCSSSLLSSQCPTPVEMNGHSSMQVDGSAMNPLDIVRMRLAAIVRGDIPVTGGSAHVPTEKKRRPSRPSSSNSFAKVHRNRPSGTTVKLRKEILAHFLGQEHQEMLRIHSMADTTMTKEELDSDPMSSVYGRIVDWDVDKLYTFLMTTEFAVFGRILREQEVDGYSFALLDFQLLKATLWNGTPSLTYKLIDLVKLSKLTAQIRAITGLRLN